MHSGAETLARAQKRWSVEALQSKLSPWTYLLPYRSRMVIGASMLLATNLAFLGIPVTMGLAVEALRGPDPSHEVPRYALFMVLFAIATAVTRIVSRVMIFNAGRAAEYDLRSDLFGHLMTLEPAYYREHPTGDVMTRLTSDVATVRALWGAGVLNVVNTACAFVPVLFMMLRIDPWLTLFAILPYPTIFFIGQVMGRQIYKASRGAQEHLGQLSNGIQEDLTGIQVIKSYGVEDERRGAFRVRSERLLERNMELVRVRGQMTPALSALGSAAVVLVLWIGGRRVLSGHISLGHMVEFLGYLARLAWPTLALGWMIQLMQRGRASWVRLQTILERKPVIADDRVPADGGLALADVKGDVRVQDLTITIDGRTILDRINLHLSPGTVTAIVGRTGSGKSTLVDCLTRLIDVPAGTVFLDGRDINCVPLATLRGAVGYAPQEAFLFSTSIADNIAFGYGAGTVKGAGQEIRAMEVDARAERAAEAAGLARDLAALPDAYGTIVGERGITLSGGQRQRVALARALASEPKVLILDDSLSSVDAETERVILDRLEQVMHGRTSVLISHRVAAVKNADQIVVLDEGRIAESGSHDALLAKGGLYAELYRTQLEASAEAA